MRFLRKNKINKSILVISDIHLGAGAYVDGKRNYLEDFHYDTELVEFLEFYSSGEYATREVELIINGDLFDFLAVPFVRYFDDEFWSEEASLEKLDIIIKAHREVIQAFGKFIAVKKKNIKYIIGNHDAEFVFESMREKLLQEFDENDRSKFVFILNDNGEYKPAPGVLLMHGHEYEMAHHFSWDNCIATDEEGKKYFIPPWGSYYVTRIINKFKEERIHVNAVRPIKKFIINGFIYDTLFTVRFGLANAFYFIMVRLISIIMLKKSLLEVWKHSMSELELWRDYEELTQDIFKERDDVKALIVGHTHDPIFRSYANGSIFINTGTWMKMTNLDFGKASGAILTYAQVDIREKDEKSDEDELDIVLNEWKGINPMPFDEFS